MIVNWSFIFTLYGVFHVSHAFNTIHKSSNRIVFQNGEIPQPIAKSFVNLNEQIKSIAQFEILNMRSEYHNGSYLCHLPREKDIDLHVPNSITLISDLKNKALAIIQKAFSTNNCTFSYNLHDSYWTIAYCYGDKVIQFHEELQHYISGKHEPHLPKHVYTLGRFPGSEKINKNIKIENQAKGLGVKLDESEFTIFDGEYSYFTSIQPDSETNTQKFIKHTLLNGEICDLTRRARTIDIVYKCDQSVTGPSKLLQFQEIKTCQYQMIIHVPGLCALEEFRRNIIHDDVLEMECKKIDEKSDVKVSKNVSYSDYFSYTDNPPVLGELLPNSKDFKIDLHGYSLSPCGGGYFLGTRKTESNTGNPYWDHRKIFVYSGIKPKKEPEEDFGRMLLSVLDQKIPSPLLNDQNLEIPLSWNDSFIMWYEMYDYTGNFMSLFRIIRSGYSEIHSLEVETYDPTFLNKVNSIKGIMTKFEAPNNNWNFQHFSRSKYSSVVEEPSIDAETQTVTVTVTSTEVESSQSVDEETPVLHTIAEESKVVEEEEYIASLQQSIKERMEKEYDFENEEDVEDFLEALQEAVILADEHGDYDVIGKFPDDLDDLDDLDIDTDGGTETGN